VSLFRAPKSPLRRLLAPFRYLETDRDASNGPGLTSLSTLSVSTLSVSILSVSTLCFVERWFLKEKAPLVCAFRFSPRATPTDMWGSACQSYLHTPSEREREKNGNRQRQRQRGRMGVDERGRERRGRERSRRVHHTQVHDTRVDQREARRQCSTPF